jgi:hypothetical protein
MEKNLTNDEESGIMSDEEWGIVQGMTHSEFQSPTEITPFFDAVDEKIKKRKDAENG